jgi:hypothetical protein
MLQVKRTYLSKSCGVIGRKRSDAEAKPPTELTSHRCGKKTLNVPISTADEALPDKAQNHPCGLVCGNVGGKLECSRYISFPSRHYPLTLITQTPR